MFIQISRTLVGISSLTRQDMTDIFSGDWMRNSRPDLETVINAGVS